MGPHPPSGWLTDAADSHPAFEQRQSRHHRHVLGRPSLAAGRIPSNRFDAVADLWGGGVVMAKEELPEAGPVAPVYYTADLSAPLLGLFGNDDTHPSPAESTCTRRS